MDGKARDYSVLVVEDDPNHAALIKVAFVQHEGGARLNVVRSAEEAIAFLESPWPDKQFGSTGMPDVIVLDWQMPGMGGEGFLEWYYPQSRVADVPVVVYTTRCDQELSRQCFGLGATGFLAKPADFAELIPAVRRALDQAMTVANQKLG